MTAFTQNSLATSIMDIPGLKEVLATFCTSPEKISHRSEDGLIIGVELVIRFQGAYVFENATPANLARSCVWLGSELEPWHTFALEARYHDHLPAIAEACRLLGTAKDMSLIRALRGMHEASGARNSHFSILLGGTYGCVRRKDLEHDDQFVTPLQDLPEDQDFQDFIDTHSLVLFSSALSQHGRLGASELGRSLSALCHPIYREQSSSSTQIQPRLRVPASTGA